MIFHQPKSRIRVPAIKMNDTQIQYSESFNFLGITIDQHLSWKAHSDKISNKISRSMGILNKLKYILPLSVKIKIYNAIILPHMNYGILVWGYNSNAILKLQKKVVRVITCAKYNAHTDPLLKQLKLLKISDIFTICKLKFYYKYINKRLPVNLQKLPFRPNQELHGHNTRQSHNLFINRYRHTFAKKCLRYDIPDTINTTPSQIKEKLHTHSYHGFTKYVKSILISNYQETCSIPNCYVCSHH